MKKIIIGIVFLFVSAFVFGEPFKNGEKIVIDFFEKGQYIKIIKDENNISFIAKSTVSGINIDEDDIEIATIGYNVMTGKNGDSESYNIKRWNIVTDENGNIIISSKSKK